MRRSGYASKPNFETRPVTVAAVRIGPFREMRAEVWIPNGNFPDGCRLGRFIYPRQGDSRLIVASTLPESAYETL